SFHTPYLPSKDQRSRLTYYAVSTSFSGDIIAARLQPEQVEPSFSTSRGSGLITWLPNLAILDYQHATMATLSRILHLFDIVASETDTTIRFGSRRQPLQHDPDAYYDAIRHRVQTAPSGQFPLPRVKEDTR
ncbi:hypothetical protein Agub_g14880, partial [Astrephomene gubernaculifera]